MDIIDIVILALIQGITEFLPISSSGHLVLYPLLFGRPDQGATMDVAVHLGTLVAVCIYFRTEVGKILIGAGKILRGDLMNAEAYLTMLLVIATIPAIIFGLALKVTDTHTLLRTIEVIGWTTLIGGILLGLADRATPTRGAAETWRIRDAVLMGLAQAFALIPGTSRSGITMTMARWLGFDRVQAARLALLMAVPTILAAGAVETLGVIKDGDLRVGTELLLGAGLSFVAALLALSLMFRLFRANISMLPYVIYRLCLGGFLLWIAYGGGTVSAA